MSPEEKEWLDKVKCDKHYQIVVDNDSIWIDDVVEENCVFQFDDYGEDFIVSILRYLGFNATHC